MRPNVQSLDGHRAYGQLHNQMEMTKAVREGQAKRSLSDSDQLTREAFKNLYSEQLLETKPSGVQSRRSEQAGMESHPGYSWSCPGSKLVRRTTR